MQMSKKPIAIKLLHLALLAAACLLGQAHAQTAGQVINLSGPLFAIKGDGVKRVMSVGSEVEAGDTLITEAKTYARIRFADASEVTLRPESRLTVEGFTFKQQEPARDNAVFKLFKGAMRTVTGLVGKRGNQDAYKLNTPTATIGIRGTQFIAEYIPDENTREVAHLPYGMPLLAALTFGTEDTLSDVSSGLFDVQPLLAQAPPPPPRPGNAMAPGLYVHVIDGLIHLTNAGGSQNFSAGQFGFTPSFRQPPVILPNNPGLQFSPPPAFNNPINQPGSNQSGSQGGSGAVSCEVR